MRFEVPYSTKPGDKKQAIKASVGTAFRTPVFLESYLDLPVQLQLPALNVRSQQRGFLNPEFRLGPENILSVELGYINRQSDLFDVEGQLVEEINEQLTQEVQEVLDGFREEELLR